MANPQRVPERPGQPAGVVLWRAPWITVLGPVLVAAFFDLVVVLGKPGVEEWLLVLAATAVGLIGSWIMRHSLLKVTGSHVIVQNGLFVDTILRQSVRAVQPQRNGVDIYFSDEGSLRMSTARATGAAAGYLKGSRTAAIAHELSLLLDAPKPADDMRRRARST